NRLYSYVGNWDPLYRMPPRRRSYWFPTHTCGQGPATKSGLS
ncbi:unnamed protein product, partial [Ectocarpus sp. 6 AP-2014]